MLFVLVPYLFISSFSFLSIFWCCCWKDVNTKTGQTSRRFSWLAESIDGAAATIQKERGVVSCHFLSALFTCLNLCLIFIIFESRRIDVVIIPFALYRPRGESNRPNSATAVFSITQLSPSLSYSHSLSLSFSFGWIDRQIDIFPSFFLRPVLIFRLSLGFSFSRPQSDWRDSDRFAGTEA